MPAGSPISIRPVLDTCLDNPLAYPNLCFAPETSNVLIRDKEFQTRPGLHVLGNTINERTLGSIWVRDLTSISQIIVGTSITWRKFSNALPFWSDLSGGVVLTQSALPITFTYFFQGGVQYIIGVNGTDPTKEYNLAGTPGAYANLANAPIARTVCTVAGRVFFGAIKVGGVLFPQTVQWSATGQRTVYPALAKNDIGDTSDHIMLVLNLGRRAVAIMKEQSQWLGLSQPGSDANAFEFQLLDYQPGPMGPAAGDRGPGGLQIVYLGTDFNLRAFDGVKGTIIKETQKHIASRYNYAARELTSVKYFPSRQEIWCAMPLDTDALPTHVMIYSYITRGIYIGEVPSGMPITHIGLFQAEFDTVTDALPDIPTDQLPDIPTDQLGVTSRGQSLLAGSTAKIFSFEGSLDDTNTISNDWRIVLPVIPGSEYEFDGVEVQLEPTPATYPLTISVLTGQTYDNLAETVLGVIDPTAAAVFGETISLRLGDDHQIRARIVVVRFSGNGSFLMRSCEIYAWPRRILA